VRKKVKKDLRTKARKKGGKWFVYIVECADGSYYTGMTLDPGRRLEQHRTGRGAAYTKMKGVRGLVYCEKVGPRVKAMKRELAIKRMAKSKKTGLVEYRRLKNSGEIKS
jgi:putative endonuclease